MVVEVDAGALPRRLPLFQATIDVKFSFSVMILLCSAERNLAVNMFL